MFIDLNVPWNEVSKPNLPAILACYERLGYDAVVLNHTCIARLPKTARPFGRVEYPSTGKRRPLRQYTRLTLVLDNPQQNYGINSANEIVKSYDFLAIQPQNERMLLNVVNSLDCDIISIDIGQSRLPFQLKHGVVKQAIARGMYFELAYGKALLDLEGRRNVISNARLITRVTKGRNTFLACGGDEEWMVRAPSDVGAIAELLGIGKSTGVVASVPQSCLTRAGTRSLTLSAAIAILPASTDSGSSKQEDARLQSDFAEDFIRL